MQTFGPLTLTPNSLTQVSCSPASTLVYIGNDSPYDVLVSFSVSQPPLVTTAGGTGDWTAVVQAFHHATLPTPANMSTPQGSTFAGNVWLLPLNTRNPSMALNGAASGVVNCWVIACLRGEQPPDAYAAPRQSDLTSQPRVISVPIASSFNINQTVSLNAGQSLTLGLNYDVPFPVNTPLIGYCYSLLATQVTGKWAAWGINLVTATNAAVILNAARIMLFVATGDTTATPPYSTPVVFTPPHPIWSQLNILPTSFFAGFQVSLIAAAGASASMELVFGGGIDISNEFGVYPADIGGSLISYSGNHGNIF